MSRLLDIVKAEGYVVKVAHRRPVVQQFKGSRRSGSKRERIDVLFTRFELDKLKENEVVIGEMNNMDVVQLEFDLRGGETRVLIWDALDMPPVIGLAFCSDEDVFDRKVGLDIALKRALQRLGRGDLIARAYADDPLPPHDIMLPH